MMNEYGGGLFEPLSIEAFNRLQDVFIRDNPPRYEPPYLYQSYGHWKWARARHSVQTRKDLERWTTS